MREQMKKNTVRMLIGLIFLFGTILSACKISGTSNSNVNVEEPVVFEGDPDHLLPCGAFERMRLLQPPDSTTSFLPNATPVANTAVATPLPAPMEDRVGFPKNFATDFKLLFVFDRPDRQLVRAICGNDIVAKHKEGEPFAYGSILFMISYSAKLNANGQPLLDENGHYIRENFVAYHVMRKEKGFGEAYGDDRAGEWEFVAYKADGKSYDTRPENSNFCAACHNSDGGESVDSVMRMNLVNGAEADVAPPPVNENEISIYLYGFHEPELEVKAGTTVTWINNDQAQHLIKAAVVDSQGKVIPAPNGLFDSGILPSVNIKPGASFSFTFDKPGEYYFLCINHAHMTGKIIVTK
jgi:plastocyanin